MKCIIIEDQLPAQSILIKYINDIETLCLQATFNNALEALKYLQNHSIDLIFLDIHLPKISGIDFLKTLHNPPKVILTTAFSDYALESYELNVVDYLLKPFSFKRFLTAVQKIKIIPSKVSNNKIKSEIFIKSGYEHIKIKINDIVYIKSDMEYTELICSNKSIVSSESLRYWEDYLKDNSFKRIHKSYLINTNKIEKITSTTVYLHLNNNLPIGRVYKENILKLIN